MEFRPATAGDVPAIVVVLAVNGEGHLGPDYVEHVLQSGIGLVAVDGHEVVGFGASVTRNGVTHIADLYVDPAHQGRRIGQTLLSALVEPGAAITTFSSSHPAAVPLYVRAGLTPWWPLFYFEGRPARPLVSALRVDSTTAAEVAALDHPDRRIDHSYFESRPGTSAFIVRLGALVRGGGHFRDGILDVTVVADDADPADVIIAAVSALATATSGSIGVAVPGPHPALPRLLECGLPITGRDLYCSTDSAAINPYRRLPHPGLG
jgi:GNAT superfamily N-acetyltransferase